MPAGTHKLGIVNSQSVFSVATNGYNFATEVTFSQDVILKSVLYNFSGSGTWTGAVMVWRVSNQSLVYTDGGGTTIAHSISTSGENEITLPNPPTLSAGVAYKIGHYTSSGVSPRYVGNASSVALTSTPSGLGASITGPYWYNYNNTAGIGSYPGTGSGANEPYNTITGVYVDIPNTKPAVSNLFSSSINPLTDSKLTWTYSDPESNPQTHYQIGWRKQGSGENHNFFEYQSANHYHTIPAGTLEEGVTYDWAVRVKDSGGLWSEYATNQFTSISPYRIETVVNIATNGDGGYALGSATYTTNYSWSGSSWTRILHNAAGAGGRFLLPLSHLVSGQTYTISMTVANAGAASAGIAVDFCDANSNGHTLAAGEVRRITFNGTRSTYDNTYRFVDVHGPNGSDILVKDIVVAPGADKSQHYFNGDTADTPSTLYRWLGAPAASPSVKEVFGLTNRILDPKPVATTRYSGNSTMVIEGDAIKVTTPAAGTTSTFLPWGVDQLVSAYKGDRVEARFLYKGPGDRVAIWHVCDSAGNIVQQHVTALPSSPSAYTEVVCAGTNTTDNAMSVRFVQLCYGSGATGASAPHYFKNIIVHEVNRSGPYFDGSHVNSGLGLQQWTGTVNDSTSTKTTTSGIVKNLIPGDAEAQSGWSVPAWNWSGAVVSSGGVSGGKFQRITATAATQTAGMYLAGIWGVEAGQQYTLTCKMRASAAGTTWHIAPEWRRLDGSQVYNESSGGIALPANTWTEVGSVLTAPEGAYGVTFCMYKTLGNLPSGGYVDIDEPFMAISRDGIKLNYFDGNTTDTSTYQYLWEGAAGTSTSIRAGGFWTGLNEVTSATASGTIDASSLVDGDYEVQVAVTDGDGIWGEWGAPETFALGPASNVMVKSGGTFATGLRLVKQGGVWIETGVTKVKSGGVFI